MADTFDGFTSGLDSPAANAATVTPNDSTDLTTASRGIYIGGAGDLRVTMVGKATVTLSAVPAGTLLPLRVVRVLATSTTATNIVALW